MLCSFSDATLLDARGANFHTFYFAVYNCANALQIRIPSAISDIMCVTDVMSKNGFLTADITNFCHLHLQNFH